MRAVELEGWRPYKPGVLTYEDGAESYYWVDTLLGVRYLQHTMMGLDNQAKTALHEVIDRFRTLSLIDIVRKWSYNDKS